MKILSLNCQKGHQLGLEEFLKTTLNGGGFDIFILQEVTDKVFLFLNHPSYNLVQVFSDELGRKTELCLAYKKSFKLIGQGFKSFASMRNDPVGKRKHPCFGILWIDLQTDKGPVRIVSIHLHSGIYQKVRLLELKLAKEILLKEVPMPTIVSGDFNAGFPGEPANMAEVFKHEFIWKTKDLGPTLDSRYSENLPHLPNRIAAFLSLFNIRIPLWTDHVFVDRNVEEKYSIHSRILPDRVSDHSPVEIMLEPIQ